MDNVGIVVESLDAAISFFAGLGLELEGRAVIEGDWSGRVTGLRDQRVETAMMRTPDGHGRIELSRFLTPPTVADHRNAPVNALGYLRVMFAVDDLDDTLARLREHGAQLVDEVVQYEDVYRLRARPSHHEPVGLAVLGDGRMRLLELGDRDDAVQRLDEVRIRAPDGESRSRRRTARNIGGSDSSGRPASSQRTSIIAAGGGAPRRGTRAAGQRPRRTDRARTSSPCANLPR
jgi:catechol 2,3-dioxygenase-like lactoylglutathione lyase family enzyme